MRHFTLLLCACAEILRLRNMLPQIEPKDISTAEMAIV